MYSTVYKYFWLINEKSECVRLLKLSNALWAVHFIERNGESIFLPILPYLRVKGIHVYIRRFDNRNSLGSNNWTIKCIWIICLYICGFPQAWKVSSLSCKQPWPSQEDSACFCLPHPPNPPRHDDRACFSHIVEYFYSTSSYAKKVCNQMSCLVFVFFTSVKELLLAVGCCLRC